MSITLSDKQNDAVKAIKQWSITPDPVFYLAGYAGSGKTSILPAIVEATGVHLSKVAFCAPTAKAAMVMSDKLLSFDLKSTARTIHHCIYIPRELTAKEINRQIKYLKSLMSKADTPDDEINILEHSIKYLELTLEDIEGTYRDAVNFVKKETFSSESCINPRLIIVDEASMVGTRMGKDLLSFNIPIIAIGDPAQLQPIKDTAFLTAGNPDFFIDEIHRQARDNPIIRLATMAREGIKLPIDKLSEEVKVVYKKDDDTTLADRAIQVICGRHKTKWRLTEKIRDKFGFTSNSPQEGEPLIVVKNNYVYNMINGYPLVCARDAGDLISGEATYSLDVETEGGVKLTLDAFQPIMEEHEFHMKDYYSCTHDEAKKSFHKAIHIDFNWVTTCHKAQGSEWDEVCVHDESRFWKRDAKSWLYTAITRAKSGLTVVVPNKY